MTDRRKEWVVRLRAQPMGNGSQAKPSLAGVEFSCLLKGGRVFYSTPN